MENQKSPYDLLNEFDQKVSRKHGDSLNNNPAFRKYRRRVNRILTENCRACVTIRHYNEIVNLAKQFDASIETEA